MLMKRIFDIFFATFLILIFSPVMLTIYWCVYVKLGTPVFFRQLRSGKDGKSFVLYKFRTMIDLKDDKNIPDSQRLTRFGCFLRSTSMDELPSLFNVLLGSMSLVGPRPLLPEYMSLYSDEQLRRFRVKPGITGWAQVNGRNAIGWQEKFNLDCWYVDNMNLFLDVKILLLTVKKVILREGITSPGDATSTKFTGND